MGEKKSVYGWLMDMVSNEITASNSKYGGVLGGGRIKFTQYLVAVNNAQTRIVISIIIIIDEVQCIPRVDKPMTRSFAYNGPFCLSTCLGEKEEKGEGGGVVRAPVHDLGTP